MIISVDIPVKQPFNWQECLWYLHRDYDEVMYNVYSDKVRRAFSVNNKDMLVEISFMGEVLHVEWLTGEPGEMEMKMIRSFVSEWFDVESDLTTFYKLLENRRELAYMATSYYGLRFVGMPDLFEALLWTIIGQQINLPFAYRIKRRLVETYGSFIIFEGNKYWIFPRPEVLVAVSISELRELQLSNRKAAFILNITNAFLDKTLSKDILFALPDFEARQRLLTNIKGIGVWTANYVLMKSLKESAAVPYGDAGLPKAMIAHKLIVDKNNDEGIKSFYNTFSGWEYYMSIYLWRSLSKKKDVQTFS